MEKRDDGHGPYEQLPDERIKDIARCYYALRASELEGTYMARELLALRERLKAQKGREMGQPQNESALRLISEALTTCDNLRRELDENNIDREQAQIDVRSIELNLSTLVQKLDRIETICTDAVRDNATAEEIYHRVQDVLHAAPVAPSGRKGPTE